MSEQKLSKSEYAQMMKEKRKELYDKANREAMLISKDQDRFLSFLDLHSRLNYTMNNSLLIHADKPDATEIRSFVKWKEAGSPVIPRETGIRILEPDGTYLKKDGTPAAKFKISTVFDISQTNAKPVQTAYDLKDVRDALIFGEEDLYSDKRLPDCIDLYCMKEKDHYDEFIIDCAGYLLRKRYGITPCTFHQDAVSYFSNLPENISVKDRLKAIDSVYGAIRKKIDRGLYIKEQEADEYGEEG